MKAFAKKVRLINVVLFFSFACTIQAQNSLPTAVLPFLHPRLFTNDPQKEAIQKLIQSQEWAEISKTGRIVDAINNSILQLAYSATFMHWVTGEEKYARFGFDLFDTYLTGMYYRREPKITNGHHQTIISLSTLEVIQEVGLLHNLTGIYDFLYPYLQSRAAQKLPQAG